MQKLILYSRCCRDAENKPGQQLFQLVHLEPHVCGSRLFEPQPLWFRVWLSTTHPLDVTCGILLPFCSTSHQLSKLKRWMQLPLLTVPHSPVFPGKTYCCLGHSVVHGENVFGVDAIAACPRAIAAGGWRCTTTGPSEGAGEPIWPCTIVPEWTEGGPIDPSNPGIPWDEGIIGLEVGIAPSKHKSRGGRSSSG